MDSLNNHSPMQESGSLRNAISTGADLGMKAGCLLSTLYSVLAVVVILATTGALNSVSLPLVALLPLHILPIYLLILIPVLPLGAITGALLGWLSKLLSGTIPKQRFFRVGIFVCVVLLLIIHVAFFTLYPLIAEQDSGYENEWNSKDFTVPLVPWMSMQTYLIFIGIPSIIYIVGGGWVSHKLALKT
jgi:hypothetical protein